MIADLNFASHPHGFLPNPKRYHSALDGDRPLLDSKRRHIHSPTDRPSTLHTLIAPSVPTRSLPPTPMLVDHGQPSTYPSPSYQRPPPSDIPNFVAPVPKRTPTFRLPSIPTPPSGLWQICSSDEPKAIPKAVPPSAFASFSPAVSATPDRPTRMASGLQKLIPPLSVLAPCPIVTPQPQYPSGDATTASLTSDRLAAVSLHRRSVTITAKNSFRSILEDALTNDDARSDNFFANFSHERTQRLQQLFIQKMAAQRARNPHAPIMASFSNPLRDEAPSRTWALMEDVKKDSKFKTPLRRSQQPRSRRICERILYRLPASQYLNGNIRHCPHCKRDSLGKRLLVLRHCRRQDDEFLDLILDEPTPDDVDLEPCDDLIDVLKRDSEAFVDFQRPTPTSAEEMGMDDIISTPWSISHNPTTVY